MLKQVNKKKKNDYFKWNRERVKSVLKNIFEKIGRIKIKVTFIFQTVQKYGEYVLSTILGTTFLLKLND